MYGLYGWLLAKGQIAFMNAKFNHSDCIAVYPEIQQGNPAEANTVVRYILNKPGLIPALMSDGTLQYGQTEFDESDKLIYFSRMFGGEDSMFLPILDLHLFRDQGKKRTKTAYFVGKGIKDPDIERKFTHPKDAILIDRDLAQDQAKLADLLNETSVLYCYDPVSAMMEIARLCGTRIIYLSDAYSKEDYLKYEPGINGISFSTEESVELDVEKFRKHYKHLREAFSVKLDKFIDSTQK